jgi:hypothetical protein
MWKLTVKNSTPRTPTESACKALGADIIQTYWIINPTITNLPEILDLDGELLQASYGIQTEHFLYCPAHELLPLEQDQYQYILKRNDTDAFFAENRRWLPFGSHTIRWETKSLLDELIQQLKIPVTIYSDLTTCRLLD